jgi:hypothetical protein
MLMAAHSQAVEPSLWPHISGQRKPAMANPSVQTNPPHSLDVNVTSTYSARVLHRTSNLQPRSFRPRDSRESKSAPALLSRRVRSFLPAGRVELLQSCRDVDQVRSSLASPSFVPPPILRIFWIYRCWRSILPSWIELDRSILLQSSHRHPLAMFPRARVVIDIPHFLKQNSQL